MAELRYAVYVVNPETNSPECFVPGDEVPEWAVDQLQDHAWEGDAPSRKPARRATTKKADEKADENKE